MLFGIKFYNFHKKQLVRLLGKLENGERFLKLALYQGKALRNPKGTVGAGGMSSQQKIKDPTLYCTAFKKNRFYIFSRREPEDQEDKNVGVIGRGNKLGVNFC